MNCLSLSTVTFSTDASGVTNIETIGQNAFFNTVLESVTIPASVTVIEDGAFSYCPTLNTLTFSDVNGVTKLETIEQNAFKNANIASVTGIGDRAFTDCTSLQYAVFTGNTPPANMGTDIFTNTHDGFILWHYDLPAWSGFAYENTSIKQLPNITTATLADGVVGTSYNQTLTATGTPVIIWSVTKGNLPKGLTLQDGVISGTAEY